MQSLEMKYQTFTGCQSYSCFISFSGLVTQIMTSEGDLRSPGVPPSWPCAGPGRSWTQRSGHQLPGQKVERTTLAPHESNQAHREHIRTPGFYLPFLFGPRKESTGASSLSGASAVAVWPHHTQPLRFPKSFMLHSPDSCCRFSYSNLATEALCLQAIPGRTEPASVQPKERFTRECSLTSTRVIEAERTALHIESQDGNSCAAGDLELLF